MASDSINQCARHNYIGISNGNSGSNIRTVGTMVIIIFNDDVTRIKQFYISKTGAIKLC